MSATAELTRPATPSVPATEDETRARIAALEREAKALGSQPAAALLFHEIGLHWDRLKNPRNAAVAFQAAFKIAPKFLANIRAARKLFAEVGNWGMVVTLLDAELSATEARRTRSALLFERAQLLEQRLSREADAAAALAQCLALDPEDVSLLVQLEQTFTEKADYPSLVKIYRLMAKAMRDPSARAHYLTSAGLLLEDRVKDLTGAGALFREAFALDRKDPQLLSAMKRLAQRENTPDEELAALAAEAEGQGALAGPTFLQISRAYERLGRPEDSLAALLAAQRASPDDPLVLAELGRLYESQGRYQELAGVLMTWLARTTEENDTVALNLRLAGIYEDQLKQLPEASERYKAVLAKVPGHTAALQGLGKLCYRTQNWQGLFEVCEAEAAATDEPRQKASRLYKAAETAEERLGKIDEAIMKYLQCLQLVPGFLPAQKALTRLYEKLGRFADLVAMLEGDLMQTTDKELQVTTLNRIAAIQEDRLGDVNRAIETLKRVLDLTPDHLPTMRNLARLYERGQQWQKIVELNDREAALSQDTKQAISLAHRNAEIVDEQLRERPAAIVAWEKVLNLAPTYQPALRALGRLYGQEGRWEALVKMYRTEAEISQSTDHSAGLIVKIGELYEQKLQSPNDAIAAYREVLTLAPSHSAALSALARIYRSQGDWESLIEILHAEAANKSDPTERANATCQAATIWEDHLARPDKAIEGYLEVLRLSPTHGTALMHLERLLTQRDDVKELVVLLDRQSQAGAPATRVGALLKLARLYFDRLNEPARAASCCEAALAIEPKSLSALRLLERVRSADKVRRAEIRNRIADTWGDPRLAAAIRLSNLEQTAQATPSEDVLSQLRAAFAADPSDEALGLSLERALLKVGDARGLLEVYQARRSLVTDPADQLELNLRIAEITETQLDDLPGTLAAYQACLAGSPDLYPALMGVYRCHARRGDVAHARAALEAIANHSKDAATVTQALLDAATLTRDVEKNDELAMALFKKVLEREPLHAEASAGLEDILARRGGASDLAALCEKRAESRLAQRDAAGAGKLFLEAARKHLELQARERANAALDKALQADATLIEALELKGELSFEAKDFVHAAHAWTARLQQGGEVQKLAPLHLKLGAIFQDQLQDLARATAHLQAAAASMPGNVEALERLAAIHVASRNLTGAADCLRRLLEAEQSPQGRARHTLSLARLFDEGLNDPAQALNMYRRAMDMMPGDPVVLDKVAALSERTGNLPELVRVLEQQAQSAGDPKKAAALKLRVAAILQRASADPQRAVVAYKQVLELDPSQVPAWVALADIYGKDQSTLALTVDAHRNALKYEPARLESLHALFRAWEGLRQLDKAFCVSALLVFLRAANEVEQAFFNEGRNRLPNEFKGVLGPPDVQSLHHPYARNLLVDVLRAIGDQFSKMHPPQFEASGIDRKADRLKPDHAIFKAVHAVSALFGVEELEVYQARRGLVMLETTEVPSVCIGPDVIRRFNVREQRFHFGRGAIGLLDKTALLRRLSTSDVADVLGSSVRIHVADYAGLGKRNEELSKQLRKAYSRKALKALEEPSAALASLQAPPNVDLTLQGLTFTSDRAGLLVSADPSAGLGLCLREDPAARVDSSEAIVAAVHHRPDLRELVAFSISDDFFRLRQRIGLSLG